MPDILTTHVGSLPRGNELTPLLLARDQGKPYDAAALERLVQAAVEDAVAKQEAAGISIAPASTAESPSKALSAARPITAPW